MLQTYGSLLAGVLTLLALDATIDALGHNAYLPRTSQPVALLWLVAQFAVRVAVLVLLAYMLSFTSAWRRGLMDAFVSYKAIIITCVVAILSCTLLRVYRVLMASYDAQFATLKEQWESPLHMTLFMLHTPVTLIFYYVAVGGAATLGRVGVLTMSN